tara:strand:- start:17257 stop:17796 length:540 start_codon:yes stop_codon:yes gene_type:complete
MIKIHETELLKLLKTAYEEGWYGSKDMAETVAQKLIKDIQPDNCIRTQKLLSEAEEYYQNQPAAAPYNVGVDSGEGVQFVPEENQTTFDFPEGSLGRPMPVPMGYPADVPTPSASVVNAPPPFDPALFDSAENSNMPPAASGDTYENIQFADADNNTEIADSGVSPVDIYNRDMEIEFS